MSHASIPSSLRYERLGLEHRVRTLLTEMERHISTGRAFDAATPPHRELTEALHRLAYASEQTSHAARLSIRYPDGTIGRPFPVRELWLPPDPVRWLPVLQLGTLSFRHLDYDANVDLYLIRDRETRGLSQAAIERLAAARMREVLESNAVEKGGCITILQTGLEPLVVGLYRSIVDYFVSRREVEEIAPVYIQPIYYQDDETVTKGSIWGQA